MKAVPPTLSLRDSEIDWPARFSEIDRDGFTIVPQVLSPLESGQLRAEVVQAVEDDWEEHRGLPGKQRFICLDLVTRSPAFVRLLDNPKMQRVFTHFLGETCILYSSTSTILNPRQHHYTCEIHTDSPRLVPGYHLGLLMTLACDDFTEENGATYYLPGSHLSIEKPSQDAFYAGAKRVVRRAGDAVFFHPRVWHAGGVNHTSTDRVGCTVYAVRSWMKQRFDYPRMVDADILATVSERTRSFLGFDTRIPTCMEEFYREPQDRLYKSGQG